VSGAFLAELDAALAEIERLIDRGREIHALRASEGRQLGAGTRRRLRALQAALEQLAGEPSELELAVREVLERRP
jgi:hypothetical protein